METMSSNCVKSPIAPDPSMTSLAAPRPVRRQCANEALKAASCHQMPVRHVDRRTKRRVSSELSKITRFLESRHRFAVSTTTTQSQCDRFATARQRNCVAQIARDWVRWRSRSQSATEHPDCVHETTTAQKNAVPLLVGHGLRGGRWPGPHVERDGERCYCGRGWVSDGPQ